jgi:mono/diheme cytochrome c family protein
MRNLFGGRDAGLGRVEAKGLALIGLAVVLGVAAALGLVAWSAEPKALALSGSGSQENVGAPRSSSGLVATTENRGQVLFGRYCDSCHPGGDEGRGVSLVSKEFLRDFHNEAQIAQLVRDGTCKMPAYTRFLVSDGDLSEMSKFVLGRAQAAAPPPLPPLEALAILEQKCNTCHATIEPHLDPRDVQILFALNDMAKCAGLTADQRNVLRAFLLAQQGQR